jgi:hypothetical protein
MHVVADPAQHSLALVAAYYHVQIHVLSHPVMLIRRCPDGG